MLVCPPARCPSFIQIGDDCVRGHNARQTKRHCRGSNGAHCSMVVHNRARAMLSGGVWYSYVRMSSGTLIRLLQYRSWERCRTCCDLCTTAYCVTLAARPRHAGRRPCRQLRVVKGRAGTPRLFLHLALTFCRHSRNCEDKVQYGPSNTRVQIFGRFDRNRKHLGYI